MSKRTQEVTSAGSGTQGWVSHLRRRFIILSATFSAALVLLVILGIVAFQGLSGARAFVNGESQWTKAQKQAVIALFDYATTGNDEHYEAFENALTVNEGARRARLTLSSEDPDYAVARQGLLDGRNHPEDIDLMMRLFVLGRSLRPFQQAVEAWTRGDELIAQLRSEAVTLRELVHENGAATPPVFEQLESIRRLDHQLTRQESEFSNAMGRVSHFMTRWFTIAIASTALLLVAGGFFLAWRLIQISERREAALKESEQRYRALVDQPEVGMWQIDPEGHILYFNPAMRSLLAIDDTERIEGQTIEEFISPRHREKVKNNRQARVQGHNAAMEVELQPRIGSPRIALVHGAPIRIGENVVGHVGTCVDITSRKRAESELRFQVLHDPLTGLPNRRLFLDRLEMALKRGRRSGTSVAILFIDLDRFKVINDGLGHAAGDSLLRQAADRLKGVIRDRDSIARFGGDEFGLILEPVESEEAATMPAQRIAREFDREFSVDDVTTRVGVSIGIAVSGDSTEAPAELLRQADIAMYLAKRKDGAHIHVYDPNQDSFQQEHLRFENDLWRAAERGELRLFYQPIIDLESRRIETLEALVRWSHPTKGLLSPDQFISLAEDTGAITRIGAWVFQRASSDFSHMQKTLGARCPTAIAVNLSDAEFRFGDPVSYIQEASTRAGVDPENLQIEVTESMLTRQPEALHRINSLGYGIAIDDFGTGYASLDRLRQVPFNTIKIDRSFIAGFQHSRVDRSIIEAVMHVGQRLRVQIVAEGIESEKEAHALLQMGCQHGQGYLFARPGTLNEIMALIEAETPPSH
ncbi:MULTISPECIES: bifunctional diguanylate cyclase/phosphodiesterase [unclassified Wenzhouxiangella]|uniref:putative bifunctional diguanylate cyclase/phosphodiesterase n=1 Tax=unclassified Wenzhouxiangella TaxID=2613841 RepID=UPI000E3270AA|nr:MULTISPECIES: EAL domain-containing protein [unclassified Wenzhouxiangella]RFF27546.1 EAL domain-containing protein [Wenzhouxiangella sp. 15181]RFP69592.1 EAL domain-containing protein [Wenzhouxiangella sp. 15190]